MVEASQVQEPVVRPKPISRWARADREKLNTLLQAGRPLGEILQQLGAAANGMSQRKLLHWRRTGYRAWVATNHRLKGCDERRAASQATADPGRQAEAGLHLAAAQIYRVLTELDPAWLKDWLTGDTANYPRMVRLLAQVVSATLQSEKQQAQAAQTAGGANRPAEGLTSQTTAEIEDQLRMF